MAAATSSDPVTGISSTESSSVKPIPSSSKPPYSLRLAREGDAGQLAGLIARVWTHHFGWSVPAKDLEVHLATALSPETIRRSILDPNVRFVVAVSNDRAESSAGGLTPGTGPNGNGDGDDDLVEVGATPADPGETIVGTAQLIFGTSEPCLTLPNPVELNRLYIENSFQGSGLAQSLVQAAADLATRVISELDDQEPHAPNGTSTSGHGEHVARTGCSLWLGVWEDNPRAIRFYEKMGFKVVGEHKFMVGLKERKDWVMEKAVETV